VFLGSMREVVETQVEASLALATAAARAGQPAEAARLREQALQTSEQGRSRGLLDALTSAALDPAAASARAALFEALAAKRLRRDALLERHAEDDPRVAELGREINELRARIDLLDGQSQGATAGVETFALAARYVPPADVLVVEYLLGEQRSWAFLRDAAGLRVATLPAAAELETLARRVHAAWRQSGGSDEAAERALADALFAPLRASSAQSVWLVPDGALHIVPLAALAGRHGLEDRRWRLLPSIAATQLVAASRVSAGGAVWVLADPLYTRDDPRLSAQRAGAVDDDDDGVRAARGVEGLRRLPATALEAQAIRTQFGVQQPRLLTGAAADRAGFLAAAAARPRILHLATHAWSDPEDAGLATLVLSLFDAAGQPREGALRAHEIARLQLPAELVVLSGCETGLGRRIVGEGPVGLSHAFMRAGARTVVASLWPVADASTAALMAGMYRGLVAEGLAPEEALAQAQAQLRSRPRWRSPYYWAGFQVVTLEAGDRPDSARGSSDP
jgi:CHAT domain-containing protein